MAGMVNSIPKLEEKIAKNKTNKYRYTMDEMIPIL